jgi:hypothetical protein
MKCGRIIWMLDRENRASWLTWYSQQITALGDVMWRMREENEESQEWPVMRVFSLEGSVTGYPWMQQIALPLGVSNPMLRSVFKWRYHGYEGTAVKMLGRRTFVRLLLIPFYTSPWHITQAHKSLLATTSLIIGSYCNIIAQIFTV